MIVIFNVVFFLFLLSHDRYEYLWADGVKFKKPTRLSATEYVENLMEWIQQGLDDETLFPIKTGVAFPKKFSSAVKQIFKRLLRVYAHIYHAHFDKILLLKAEAHMNTSFKRMYMESCNEIIVI